MHASSSDAGALPAAAHGDRPWRVHELTGDFRLEDVWLLPGRGAPEDFPRVVELAASMDPAAGGPGPVRALWALRWRLGELLGWDDDAAGLDGRVPSLRDRLPDDLRAAPDGPDFALPFRPLYLLEDEFAAEIANGTMHGVLHLGAVGDGAGGIRVQLAVLVKPNGLLGEAYMLAIKPFRHLLVYPAMLREAGRLWERLGTPATA